MTAFTFAPASRESARARIGLQGPAGSGKTKTALRLAEGLAKGGSIGVVDTERGSALKYAPVPGRPDLGGHEFGHLPMDTHDPRHLIQAVRAAEENGIAVLIVDSWSHFWNGRGGLLEIVEQAGRKPGVAGSFGGWQVGNPIEQDMLDALLNFRGHLVVTMRTKTDYALEGTKVKKLGVKTIQREGTEYELDVVMDMAEGTATVTKTRYSGLENLIVHHPGEDVAELILEQLGQGVDPVQVIVDALMADDLTYEAALELHAKAHRRNLLASGLLHPTTGKPTTLDALLRERGLAVKSAAAQPAPAPAAATAQRPAPQQQAPAQQQPAPAADRATPPQMRMMHAAFNQLGVKGREERLRATSLIVGRPVPTANDLTLAEAKTLLDALQKYQGEDAAEEFATFVDQLEDEAVRAEEARTASAPAA